MNMRNFRRMLSVILCTVLIAAMALVTTGCGNSSAGSTATEESTGSTATEENADSLATVAEAAVEGLTETDSTATEAVTLGEGQTRFMFEVVDADGNMSLYEINTDAETVGEALQALGLIEGEDSEYGLFVTTVDGVTYDYDTDGKYWAFYVDGEYASAGVDSTEVAADSTYSFRAE